MDAKRRLSPTAIAAITAALLLGLLIGVASGVGDRLFGSGPDPRTIATSSLESMRAQNRLIAFVARYVSVTTSDVSRFGFTAERTLVLPGNVRYEVDLSKLQPGDVRWDDGSKTLSVRIPDVEIAGPEVDLAAAREYGSGGLISTIVNSDQRLDQANRAKAVADLRKQAAGETPMRLARESARQAIARSFAMPLTAAGFSGVKVDARFASEVAARDPSYIEQSISYNQAMEDARRRRSAEGQK